jgi:hypothetical protein
MTKKHLPEDLAKALQLQVLRNERASPRDRLTASRLIEERKFGRPTTAKQAVTVADLALLTADQRYDLFQALIRHYADEVGLNRLLAGVVDEVEKRFKKPKQLTFRRNPPSPSSLPSPAPAVAVAPPPRTIPAPRAAWVACRTKTRPARRVARRESSLWTKSTSYLIRLGLVIVINFQLQCAAKLRKLIRRRKLKAYSSRNPAAGACSAALLTETKASRHFLGRVRVVRGPSPMPQPTAGFGPRN